MDCAASASIQQQLTTLFEAGSLAGAPDSLLLERFVAAEEPARSAAFAALVDRHGPMVVALCRRLVHEPGGADDAAQAVFLVLARRAGSLRGGESIAPYLFGVAVRVARRANRSSQRRRRAERQGAEMAARSRGPIAPEADWSDLYAELERLPDRLRSPLVLCYLEGRTNEQASATLRVPLRTLRRRLAEARDRLQRRLGRRVGEASATALLGRLEVEAGALTAVGAGWARATGQAAATFASGTATTTGATALAMEVLRAMNVSTITSVSLVALLVSGVGIIPASLAMRGPEPPAAVAAQDEPKVATPVVGAISPRNIEGAPLPAFAFERPRLREPKTTRLRIVSATTGEPAPNATVRVWKAMLDDWYTADQRGQIVVEHSTGPADDSFSVDVWGDGLAMQRHAYGEKGEAIPAEAEIKLQPGERLGGVVTDEEGRPVGGATVYLWSHNYKRKDKAELLFDLQATTGPDGKWTTAGAPETTGEILGFAIRHPAFISDRDYGREKPTIADLRAGKAVAVLKKGAYLEGRVVDPDGKPVAGAMVVSTSRMDSFPSDLAEFAAVTDADGRYRTGQLAPGEWTLVARAPGFGPVMTQTAVAEAVASVEMNLVAPSPFRLRVVDQQNEPIEGSFVVFDTWKQFRGLGVFLWTDAEGRASWPDAPVEPIQINVSKKGYFNDPARAGSLASQEEAHVFKLPVGLSISGRVRDAETKKSIGPAQAEIAEADPESGEVKEWKGFNDGIGQVWAGDGYLNASIAAVAPAYRVRVLADGYEPFVSRVFKSEERTVYDYDVVLKPVANDGSKVTVRKADGSPLVGARVHVIGPDRSGRNVSIERGAIRTNEEPNERYARREVVTDAEGAFPLAATDDQAFVIVLGEDGWAASTRARLMKEPELNVEAYSRIEGVYRVGTSAVAGKTLQMYGFSRPGDGRPSIYVSDRVTTGEEGRFVFEKVVAVPLAFLGRSDDSEASGRVWSQAQGVRLAPGETARVTLGGEGRAVVGRIGPPAGWNQPVDFARLGTASLYLDRPSVPYPIELVRESAPANRKDRSDWQSAWEASPEGLDYKAASYRANVGLAADGSFRCDDVPAGVYRLEVEMQDRSSNRRERPFTTRAMAVDVGTMADGRSDEPLDVGTMELRPRTEPTVGKPVPALELTTVDGRKVAIPGDFAGKHLLLDFSGPNDDQGLYQIARLNGIRAKFGEEKLAIVSLVLAADTPETRAFIEQKGQAWPQAIVGTPDNPTTVAYGVESGHSTIALFLIGPDGQLVVRDFYGQAVEKALGDGR